MLQNGGTLVLVSGNPEDELIDVVNAAHNEWQWLRDGSLKLDVKSRDLGDRWVTCPFGVE